MIELHQQKGLNHVLGLGWEGGKSCFKDWVTSTKGKEKDSEKRHRYGFASTQMMNIKKVVAARTFQKMKTIQKCKRITNVTYHKTEDNHKNENVEESQIQLITNRSRNRKNTQTIKKEWKNIKEPQV